MVNDILVTLIGIFYTVRGLWIDNYYNRSLDFLNGGNIR